MRVALLPMAFLAFTLAVTNGAVAQTKSTAEEAKALTLQAVELIQAKGLDAARTSLHQDGDFKHGELYVNVINTTGVWLVYPPMPAGEGRSVLDIQDANGKFLVREIIKTATEHDEGWVDYRWLNPATKQIGPKISFVKRVPNTDMIVYVGIYQ